jgi:hypothetical protein
MTPIPSDRSKEPESHYKNRDFDTTAPLCSEDRKTTLIAWASPVAAQDCHCKTHE